MPDAAASPAAPTDVPARAGWIRWALVGVLALAFVLRLVYVLQARTSPLFDAPQMDAEYHLRWARAFASGEPFLPGEPFYRAPLYSWFLGVVLALFGDGFLAPRIVQALLGTATTGLTYLVGARAFDRRTGLIASFGAATTWTLIYFDGELLIPTLAIPLQLFALWLSLPRAPGRPLTPLACAGAGAAWGVAAIARPTVLLLLPLVALWAAWTSSASERWSARLRPLALVLGGFIVPVLPLTAYNAFAAHDPVLISSTGGVNLWIGNNPASDGSSAVLPGARTSLWEGIEDAVRMAEQEEGRELRASEVSRHYASKARAHVFANPGEALSHMLWKLRLTWCSWELGNNTEIAFFARRFGPILRVLPLSFGLLAPLGLIGLLLLLPRWRTHFPLLVFVPVQTVAVALFFVNARFRLPLVPVLCVLGSFALVRAVRALRARELVPAGLILGGAAVLGVLVHRVPETIDRSGAAGYYQLGVLAMQRGDVEEAARFHEQALEANPRYAYAHRGLAAARLTQGSLDAAQHHYEELLRWLPNDVEALDALARILAMEPERGDLCDVATRLVAVAPGLPSAHFYLGRCRLDNARARERVGAAPGEVRSELEAARAAFTQALALEVDFASAHHLGLVLLELLEFEAAEQAFAAAEGFLTVPDPGGFFWANHRGRVRAWVGAGRSDEAQRHAEELWRRYQGDPTHSGIAREILLEARP